MKLHSDTSPTPAPAPAPSKWPPIDPHGLRAAGSIDIDDADDATLLGSLASDDVAAEVSFGELVRRHFPKVVAAARRQTGDVHLAEEVAQAAISQLARDCHAIRDPARVGPWLMGVVRRSSLKMLREIARRRRRETRVHQVSLAGESHAADRFDGCKALLHAELKGVIEAAIDSLDHRDRQAIRLRFYESASFKQIGASQRTSEEAARKRVVRALTKLRSHLERAGYGGVSIPAVAVLLWCISLPTAVTAVPLTAAAAAVAATVLVGALVTHGPASQHAVAGRADRPDADRPTVPDTAQPARSWPNDVMPHPSHRFHASTPQAGVMPPTLGLLVTAVPSQARPGSAWYVGRPTPPLKPTRGFSPPPAAADANRSFLPTPGRAAPEPPPAGSYLTLQPLNPPRVAREETSGSTAAGEESFALSPTPPADRPYIVYNELDDDGNPIQLFRPIRGIRRAEPSPADATSSHPLRALSITLGDDYLVFTPVPVDIKLTGRLHPGDHSSASTFDVTALHPADGGNTLVGPVEASQPGPDAAGAPSHDAGPVPEIRRVFAGGVEPPSLATLGMADLLIDAAIGAGIEISAHQPLVEGHLLAVGFAGLHESIGDVRSDDRSDDRLVTRWASAMQQPPTKPSGLLIDALAIPAVTELGRYGAAYAGDIRLLDSSPAARVPEPAMLTIAGTGVLLLRRRRRLLS